MVELLERGGVYPDLKGTTPGEVLSSLAGALPPIPSVPADRLLTAILEREALMSTGIGMGIALPHPRNPLVREEESFVALGFTEQPVDWNSLDGVRVDTLLLIVSVSAKQHLRTLSEINYLCRREDFYRLLKKRAPLDEILNFIREAERKWE